MTCASRYYPTLQYDNNILCSNPVLNYFTTKKKKSRIRTVANRCETSAVCRPRMLQGTYYNIFIRFKGSITLIRHITFRVRSVCQPRERCTLCATGQTRTTMRRRRRRMWLEESTNLQDSLSSPDPETILDVVKSSGHDVHRKHNIVTKLDIFLLTR